MDLKLEPEKYEFYIEYAGADGSHDVDQIWLDRAGMLVPIGIAPSELHIVSLLYIENNQETYTSQLQYFIRKSSTSSVI